MKATYRTPKRIVSALIAVILSLLCFSPAVLAAGSEDISLSAWDRSEALNFTFVNMVPGDSEMKEYAIKVTDKKAVYIQFSADIISGDKLAEALSIKVLVNGDGVYDGALADMGTLTHEITGSLPQTVSYNVTFYMATSVTSEYAGLSLETDLKWTIAREETPVIPPEETTTEETTANPGMFETTAVWESSAENAVRDTTRATTAVTTTVETTTAETTTQTAPTPTTEITTAETTTEVTTKETTAETTTAETTSLEETTTGPVDPPISTYCCDCCVGYYFPHSCDLNSADGSRCGLPWCCNRELGIECWCPWCWIVPLAVIILMIVIVFIVARKLSKSSDGKEEPQTDAILKNEGGADLGK